MSRKRHKWEDDDDKAEELTYLSIRSGIFEGEEVLELSFSCEDSPTRSHYILIPVWQVRATLDRHMAERVGN